MVKSLNQQAPQNLFKKAIFYPRPTRKSVKIHMIPLVYSDYNFARIFYFIIIILFLKFISTIIGYAIYI